LQIFLLNGFIQNNMLLHGNHLHQIVFLFYPILAQVCSHTLNKYAHDLPDYLCQYVQPIICTNSSSTPCQTTPLFRHHIMWFCLRTDSSCHGGSVIIMHLWVVLCPCLCLLLFSC
jgi:hypothetical protein